MVPLDKLKTSGQRPGGRFITTYSCDYKPFSQRHVQVIQPKAETKALPASLHLLQTKRETWPVFYQYFYKTTNGTYGSQPPSRYLSPPSTSPFGILAPSIFEGEARDVRVARETGHFLGEEEKGQLSCVCGGNGNVLEQQAARDEPRLKIDVHYETGMIVFSSHVDPASCEDFLRCLCPEAMLQQLLHLAAASGPIIAYRVAGNWDGGGYVRDWTLAANLDNSASLQPVSQCTCGAQETEWQSSCCFEMHTFTPHVPRGSSPPLAHVPPTCYCTELSRKPPPTEYQSSYAAEWVQPKIRMSDFHLR